MNATSRMCALAAVLLCVPQLSAADTARNPQLEGETLQTVLDRIHRHVDQDAWKDPGWKDAQIEAWLDKLTKELSKSCEHSLKMPTAWADLKPIDPAAHFFRNGLALVRTMDAPSVQRCIILADGSVRVSSLHDSIVIARGAVNVSSASNSWVIAGHHLQVSIASDRKELASVYLTRGWADLSIAHNSIVCGLEGVTCSIPENITFVNCKPTRDPRQPHKLVTVADFSLGTLPLSPLHKEIELLGTVSPPGAVFRFQGRRLMADVGQPIVDEIGQPVAGLGNWRLTYVNSGTAILSTDELDIAFRRAKK